MAREKRTGEELQVTFRKSESLDTELQIRREWILITGNYSWLITSQRIMQAIIGRAIEEELRVYTHGLLEAAADTFVGLVDMERFLLMLASHAGGRVSHLTKRVLHAHGCESTENNSTTDGDQ